MLYDRRGPLGLRTGEPARERLRERERDVERESVREREKERMSKRERRTGYDSSGAVQECFVIVEGLLDSEQVMKPLGSHTSFRF